MCDQIDRVAIPWFSLPHTSYDLLSLLTVENVLGQYSSWPVRVGVFETDVKGVVASGSGIVGEKGETQIIGVFVLLFFIHSIVID